MFNLRLKSFSLLEKFQIESPSGQEVFQFHKRTTHSFMVARFPLMIGVIHASIKMKASFCETPVNNLCLRVLRLLREHSLIYGFTYVSTRNTRKSLYPRVCVQLKYGNDIGTIRALKVYKNSYSNSTFMTRQFSKNRLYVVSTPKGLSLTTLVEYYAKNKHAQRILAQVYV